MGWMRCRGVPAAFSVLACFALAVRAGAEERLSREPFRRIDAAAARGDLDDGTGALLRYHALFEPARVPPALREDAQPVVRCATGVVRAARLALAAAPAALARLAPARGPLAPGDEKSLAGASHVDSDRHPVRVHWFQAADAVAALEALAAAEQAYDLQLGALGFRAPLSDAGVYGGDGRLDIVLKRKLHSAFTVEVAYDESTAWDDAACRIAIDPVWFGGPYLRATVAHEINHACQAADDWWEVLTTLESTATLVEELTYDGDDFYRETLGDFQQRSRLPFEHRDDYQTFFMYGGVSYLLFLRDRYAGGSGSFIGAAWLAMRSKARGSYQHPEWNEPDFAEGFESALLSGSGTTWRDSVLEFARWRWFVGSRDDGEHFEEGATWPDSAEVLPLAIPLKKGKGARTVADVRPGGVRYLRVELAGAPAANLEVRIKGKAKWRVEALHDGGPGLPMFAPVLEGKKATGVVPVAGASEVVLLLHRLQGDGYDPDYFKNQGSKVKVSVRALP